MDPEPEEPGRGRLLTTMSLAFYEAMVRLLRAGRTVAVATLVARQGSTPRASGARMIVGPSGDATFSIGGGAFEAMVIEDAREAIRLGRGFEKEYRFTEQGQNALGMVCGGTARVLFEVVRAPCPLFVFGGGHVGLEVARLAAGLGFDVTVIDDRPDYVDPARYPQGTHLVRAERDFSGGLPPVPAGAYVAILTRCHKTDLLALQQAVGRGAAYVGLIGSRRKIATVLARAEELGVPRDALADVHGPIGLPIGAETAEEVAVSIAAEMIRVRSASGLAAARASVTPFARRRPRARPA